MKRFNFLLFILFSFLSFASTAQTFNKGDKFLNFGIGFGSVYGFTGSSSSTPALSGSFEIGVTDKLGIGRIGVGGIIGYSGYKYNGGGFNYSSNHILIGARGAYHFDLDVEKLDLYAGVMLGYNNVSYSDNFGGYNPGGSALVGGIFGGCRYFFSDKVGAFGELGYSIALLNLGVTIKF